jgi:hypothetical protein
LDAAFLGADFLEALEADFLGAAFLTAFLGADFLAAFLGAAFLAAFLGAAFLDDDFDDFLVGTLAPSFLASDKPIAIACFREVTFLPLLPDYSFPSCISCITFSTLSPACLLYFAIVNGFIKPDQLKFYTHPLGMVF